jgi:hypothetical protein
LLATIPLTAIFHHAIFYRPTCMLNCFGQDYHIGVVLSWLRNDPSLPLALLAAIVVWVAGLYLSQIRPWVFAFFLAFLPLSIWIWDIPFTGRLVCYTFHDGKTLIHSRHLYIFGIAAWFPIAILLRKIPGSSAV